TYGKGSAQTIIPLGDVGGLKITTARWYTPSGRSISRRVQRDEEEADEESQPARRKRYQTSSGRIVFDGGGITPDVMESDSAHSEGVANLQAALGRKVSQFRDALTDYALTVKASGEVTSPQFTVTKMMLDEVWKRMMSRGVVMDRGIFDESTAVVSSLLSYDIARYAFGPEAEFKRRVAGDQAIKTALELASGAGSQRALLDKAMARQKTQRAENEE
ncbi:MAG: S41 family peptidase, partial [Gemmatimonadota bacterium]|nr:S41 family peptidase [Gemmatimonadota bacterium]